MERRAHWPLYAQVKIFYRQGPLDGIGCQTLLIPSSFTRGCHGKLRYGEGCHEFGEVGEAFDRTESSLNVEKGRGCPPGDLIGLRFPAGHLGRMVAVVQNRILNDVRREKRAVPRRWHVQLVQRDELLPDFVDARQAGKQLIALHKLNVPSTLN